MPNNRSGSSFYFSRTLKYFYLHTLLLSTSVDKVSKAKLIQWMQTEYELRYAFVFSCYDIPTVKQGGAYEYCFECAWGGGSHEVECSLVQVQHSGLWPEGSFSEARQSKQKGKTDRARIKQSKSFCLHCDILPSWCMNRCYFWKDHTHKGERNLHGTLLLTL